MQLRLLGQWRHQVHCGTKPWRFRVGVRQVGCYCMHTACAPANPPHADLQMYTLGRTPADSGSNIATCKPSAGSTSFATSSLTVFCSMSGDCALCRSAGPSPVSPCCWGFLTTSPAFWHLFARGDRLLVRGCSETRSVRTSSHKCTRAENFLSPTGTLARIGASFFLPGRVSTPDPRYTLMKLQL